MNKNVKVEYRAYDEYVLMSVYDGSELVRVTTYAPSEYHKLPDEIREPFCIEIEDDY